MKSTNQDNATFSPAEIRQIRESLGITQTQAGEVFGGGPKAFAKYETGKAVPSASMAKLLILAQQKPELFTNQASTQRLPISSDPINVNAAEISLLKQDELPELLSRLLHAESDKHHLDAKIHVSSATTTPDGGEDGRIQWTGSPQNTSYLPSQFCLFQCKAGKIDPAKAAKDIINQKTKQLEPRISLCLEDGGTYIMLCTHAYSQKLIEDRENALRQAIEQNGLQINPFQVAFRDADQIANWVNTYPVVSRWVLEKVSPGRIGCLRIFESWQEEHNAALIDDERLPLLQARLRVFLSNKDTVLRVVGLSGRGKSRLLLQAFLNISASTHIPWRVLYADASTPDSVTIIDVVRNLKEARKSGILVIDKCPLEIREKLESHVHASDGQLQLIVLEDDNPTLYPSVPSNDPRFFVEPAEDKTIEGIIDSLQPGLSSEDKRRLIKFADGYPKLASQLAKAWDNQIGIRLDNLHLAKSILQKSSRYTEQTFQAACLFSCFQAILPQEEAGQIKFLAALSGNQTSVETLSQQITLLREIGVLRYRGRFIWMEPRPLALELAAHQWQVWEHQRSKWDEVLSGNYNAHLKKNAAKQLALLNTRPIAREVVQHVCRRDGPFSSFAAIDRDRNAEILSCLAEVDAKAVITLLQRVFPENMDLKLVTGDTRRHLVWALEKIAFCKETFEPGAQLLLRLAAAENESWGNNATGQFKGLFPALLGDTEADGSLRIRFLQGSLERPTPEQLPIIADALLKGIEGDHFSRGVGAEIHGSRPALDSWRPDTWRDVWDYIGQCLDLLLQMAVRQDELGKKLKDDLGGRLRSFANRGAMDFVDKIITTVTQAHGCYWPKASTSLGHVLMYDKKGLPADVEKQIKEYIEKLRPQELSEKFRFLVTDMPWDYPTDKDMDFQERNQYQEKLIVDLAKDVLQESLLENFIAQLCQGSHRMAVVFGRAIAENADNTLQFLEPIKEALKRIPEKERDFNFLSGYLLGLYPKYPDVIAQFKIEASTDPVFAPALPIVCLRTELKDSDIPLALNAHQEGLFPILLLKNWALGATVANLSTPSAAKLFDYLFAGDADAFSVGLDLIGMYAHGRRHVLEDLRPQIKNAARAAGRLPDKSHHNDEYHFKELMLWLLDHGRQDQDARDLALILMKTAIEAESFSDRRLIKPLMPKLLQEFTEVIWPPLAQAVAQDPRKRWELSDLLGDRCSFEDRETPAILSMPDDILKQWCRDNPEVGPEFLASIVPVLTSRNPADENRTFHPLTRWLINEYGEQEEVLSSIASRMYNFGWSGSLTTYYDLYRRPFSELLNHPKAAVRRWADKMCDTVGREVDREANRDAEQSATWDV